MNDDILWPLSSISIQKRIITRKGGNKTILVSKGKCDNGTFMKLHLFIYIRGDDGKVKTHKLLLPRLIVVMAMK